MKSFLRELLVCALAGALFGAALYWGWAAEVDQLAPSNTASSHSP